VCCIRQFLHLHATFHEQGSTAGAKRSFLQTKGLTDEEIDEAVKRASVLIPQLGKTAHEVPAPSGEGQLVPASTSQEQEVQRVLKRQGGWVQSTAAVALLACAAYGIGTVLTPYAKMCWKYFRSGDEENDSDMRTQLIRLNQLFAQYTTKQDEKLDEVSKAAASAVKEIKVWLLVAEYTCTAQQPTCTCKL
jgi:hypothetical protein